MKPFRASRITGIGVAPSKEGAGFYIKEMTSSIAYNSTAIANKVFATSTLISSVRSFFMIGTHAKDPSAQVIKTCYLYPALRIAARSPLTSVRLAILRRLKKRTGSLTIGTPDLWHRSLLAGRSHLLESVPASKPKISQAFLYSNTQQEQAA